MCNKKADKKFSYLLIYWIEIHIQYTIKIICQFEVKKNIWKMTEYFYDAGATEKH